jgi:hypothetical protein
MKKPPTNKEALKALQVLHEYYSKPAREVPSSMHSILNKSFAEAISTDPFKD